MKAQTKKRVITILIGIAIIVGLYALIEITTKKVASHTNSPNTTDQRSYTGNGFFVQYPAKFTIESIDTPSAMRVINFTDRDPTVISHAYNTLYAVYINDSITNTSALETFTKKFIATYSGNPTTDITEKTIRVAGIDALQFSYNVSASSNATVYTTALLHYNTAYLIQQVKGNPNDYLNFVSSFRFQ